jgi:signal transduction histidine kinase
MAYLHVVYPSGYEQKFDVQKSLIRIGRHSANDLQIADDTVSRFHCEIVRRGNRFLVRDLQSKNGILVNEVLLNEAILNDQDRIQVGNISLRYHGDSHHGPDSTSGVELIEDVEDSEGPIVQAKRALSESLVFKDDWAQIQTTSREEVQNRLKTIATLCRQLLTFTACEDLLEETMDQIGRQLPYDRGCMMLIEGEEGQLSPKVVRDNRPEAGYEVKVAVSMTIANRCLRERTGILCTDAVRDTRFSESDSVRDLKLHSVLCVPLLGSEHPLGIIHLESLADRYVFNEMDLDFLISIASEVSVGIEHLQLRAEQADQQRLATIGRTISGLSHYIKNIMIVSEGTADIVEEALEEADLKRIREAWGVVKRNNEKVASLVRDMLLFSKRRPETRLMGNVNTLVRQTVQTVGSTAAKRRIKISVQLDDRISDGYIHAESLQRALVNVVINAIEAVSEQAEPQIDLATEKGDGDNVNILVQDNGAGIPPERLRQIFEPFYTTKGTGGTGLGLALTQKLISEMDGKIDCESQPGMGTTFAIMVPVPRTLPQDESEKQFQALGAEEELDNIE